MVFSLEHDIIKVTSFIVNTPTAIVAHAIAEDITTYIRPLRGVNFIKLSGISCVLWTNLSKYQLQKCQNQVTINTAFYAENQAATQCN
jgi:hypothetical protein